MQISRLSRSKWVRLERPYLRVESWIPSRVDRISAALCSRKVVRLQSLVLGVLVMVTRSDPKVSRLHSTTNVNGGVKRGPGQNVKVGVVVWLPSQVCGKALYLKASADLGHVAQQRGKGPKEGLVGPNTPAIAVKHHVSELVSGL